MVFFFCFRCSIHAELPNDHLHILTHIDIIVFIILFTFETTSILFIFRSYSILCYIERFGVSIEKHSISLSQLCQSLCFELIKKLISDQRDLILASTTHKKTATKLWINSSDTIKYMRQQIKYDILWQ